MNLKELRVGDVIAAAGAEWVVEMVNDCRARCRCLSRKTRVVHDKVFGTTHEFAATAQMINVSNLIEPDQVLRHDRELVNKKQTTEKDTTMKDTNKAATTKTSKKTEATPHTGLLGGIFGLSVTSVLRRLGKEGVTTAHAREIMKAMDVETSEITVSIQVNAGRRGKGGPPAELTGAQIKQLVNSAPEPKAAAKKDKESKKPAAKTPAKSGKKDAAKPAAKPAKKAAAKTPAPEKADDDSEAVVDAE